MFPYLRVLTILSAVELILTGGLDPILKVTRLLQRFDSVYYFLSAQSLKKQWLHGFIPNLHR